MVIFISIYIYLFIFIYLLISLIFYFYFYLFIFFLFFGGGGGGGGAESIAIIGDDAFVIELHDWQKKLNSKFTIQTLFIQFKIVLTSDSQDQNAQ